MLYQVVKHLRAPRETFKEALLTVLNKKATTAYVKAKEQLLLKNGLLYRKTYIGPAKETIFQFVVPQRHRSAGNGRLPPRGGTPRPTPLRLSDAGAILVARYGPGPP